MNTISHLPKCRITIGGEALGSAGAPSLESVRITQRASQAASCEITFRAPDDGFFHEMEAFAGKSLEVELPDTAAAVFSGLIVSVNYTFGPAQQRTVRIRAFDRLFALKKSQHIRSHVQVTLRDLFCEAAAWAGLTVDAQETGPLWNWIIQYQQSDLDFLSAMAQRAGSYFFLEGQTLRLFTLKGLDRQVVLERGTSLFEAAVEIDGTASAGSVATCGWNPSLMTRHAGRAGTPGIHRTAAAQVRGAVDGVDNECTIPGMVFENDAIADTSARSELDKRAASEIVVSGVAEGTPALQPGVRIAIGNLGATFDGEYVATEVVHTIDAQRGYCTGFSSRPPHFELPAEHFPVILGIVSSVDDPEGFGRIKASLPAFGDIETDWMSVALPAAGTGKGLIALPDTGDRVLISLTCGDPSYGIVLGGLCGSQAHPPEWGVAQGSVKRYQFSTPGGQRLVLDDRDNTTRIENGDGSYCDLSPGTCTIHANTDLLIEAPGKSVTIKGRKIDFNKG